MKKQKYSVKMGSKCCFIFLQEETVAEIVVGVVRFSQLLEVVTPNN